MLRYLGLIALIISGTVVWMPDQFYEMALTWWQSSHFLQLSGSFAMLSASVLVLLLILGHVYGLKDTPQLNSDVHDVIAGLSAVVHGLLYVLLVVGVLSNLDHATSTLNYTSVEWVGPVVLVLMLVGHFASGAAVAVSKSVESVRLGTSSVFMVYALATSFLPVATWVPKLFWLAMLINYGALRYLVPSQEAMIKVHEFVFETFMNLVKTPLLAIAMAFLCLVWDDSALVASSKSKVYTYQGHVAENIAKVKIGDTTKDIFIRDDFQKKMKENVKYRGNTLTQNDHYAQGFLIVLLLGSVGICLLTFFAKLSDV